MNYRTQDVTVWDSLPHPDPRTRHAPTAVRATPAFWSRLKQHVRAACDAAAPAGQSVRALWEQWLTSSGVDEMAHAPANGSANGAAHRTAGFGPAARRSGGVPGTDGLPGVVVRRVHDLLAASLDRPLALRFDSGAAASSRPPLYYLVLPNGASLTLRGGPTALEVEDCFFTRAAVEFFGQSKRSHSVARQTNGHGRSNGTASASASSLLGLSSGAFAFGDSAGWDDAPSDCADADCHAAVVKELVRRYAVADEEKGFVLPAGDDAGRARGLLGGTQTVVFVDPIGWGFEGTEPGARWLGCAAAAEGRVHQTVNGNRSHGTNGHPQPSNGTNRIRNMATEPAPRKKDSKAPGRMPRPADSAAPARPATPSAADPFSCLAILDEVLRRPAVRALLDAAHADPAADARLAYRAALAWGECRLFSHDSAAALPIRLTEAAAVELERRLARWTDQTGCLRDHLQTLGGLAAEDLRLGLLESRTEAWAAYLAVDASYADAMERGDDGHERLADVMDRLLTGLDEFDAALQECEPCLGVAQDARLLTNWRTMLAGDFRDALPWWLQCATAPHAGYAGASGH